MDRLRAYHYVLPIRFPIGPALGIFERIKNNPVIDSQAPDYLEYVKAPPDTHWIKSSMNYNRSPLYHSGALYLSEPGFCDWVIEQLRPWIPGKAYREKVAFIQTPRLGINPHIDNGPYRKAGINIGLQHTEAYTLKLGTHPSIDPEVFALNHESFTLRDGDAHILNTGNPHAVDPVPNMQPAYRVLLSYSFHETYEETLDQLGIERPHV